ncbi:hypothetical protein B9Z55_003731 [Caenorhabditis nigoni]|uniref:Uncharacterized protein n=2 Tax=Caenorhabditis nigoni TaxID=1611254 RepID=A0A2G5VRP7_9PELO|nr:hypothetical protein B9Z55_003731 [Caenorhabditis nigoni]
MNRFSNAQRAQLPVARRPRIEEVAVTAKIFPEPREFFDELILRHPELESVREWFMENRRYTMPKQIRNANGTTRGPRNCGICSSNFGGHPVAQHDIPRCPIPESYRLKFLAVNTPAFCALCYAKNDFHFSDSCNKRGDYCRACNKKLKIKRSHVPMTGLCAVEPRKEGQYIDQLRAKQHEDNAFESAEKEGPFKIQIVNDSPKPPYKERRELCGFPPLNVPSNRYGKVRYGSNSYYPGLVATYATVERDQADRMIQRAYLEAYDKELQAYLEEQAAASQVQTCWTGSPERAEQGKLMDDQLRAQKLEASVTAEDGRSQASSRDRKTWAKRVADARTLFQATKEVLQSYEGNGAKSKSVEAKPEFGKMEEKSSGHTVDFEFLRSIVMEFDKMKAKLMQDQEITEMIYILQEALTGQSETLEYLNKKEHFGGSGQEHMIAYFEVLANLAMIVMMSKEKPKYELSQEDEPIYLMLVSSTDIVIPTTRFYLAVKESDRYLTWLSWTIRVAQLVELKEEEGPAQ